METRRIGSLEVSVIGLGCNNFGGRIDSDATNAVVATALESGVTFFDTADIYGNALSEEYLGRALGTHRGEVVVATKFGIPYADKKGGASPAYVNEAVEESLRRLNTSYIDLYQLHSPDPAVPVAETLGALNELVVAGKVREIGCSNYRAAQLREANESVAGGAARYVSVQNQYNLLHRAPEPNVLAACDELSIAFLPFFPLASGLLSGKYRPGAPAPDGTRLASLSGEQAEAALGEASMTKMSALEDLAAKAGHSLLDLAFAWLLSHHQVASVIAGATKPEQIRANVATAGWQLDDDLLAQIDAVVPVK